MVQNYVLSDSVARRCLEVCHPVQEHTSKEQHGLLCRCSSAIKTGYIIYADLIEDSATASLEYWSLRPGIFSWTFQQERCP